jgi:SAM-dependent methyltransferase
VGAIFLDWLAAPSNARWLDVGCGTGAFTNVVIESCSPAAVTAVDPSPSQIDHARRQPIAQRAEFRVADAQQLPFPDGAFDVVASALVINFIPDRPRALAEMRRVGCPGGIVAGYVWDFAGERGTASPLRHALRQIGVEPPVMPGFEDSRLASLESLFEGAGLDEIATRTIDIAVAFANFDEFWRAQMPAYNHPTKAIMACRAIMHTHRTAAPQCCRPAPTVALPIRHAPMRPKHACRSDAASRSHRAIGWLDPAAQTRPRRRTRRSTPRSAAPHGTP